MLCNVCALDEKMDFSLPDYKDVKSSEFFSKEITDDLDSVITCKASFSIKEIEPYDILA